MASPCPSCGGELPVARYRRTITCTYCSASHPNPGALQAGDEVLVTGANGSLALTRVKTSTDPDAITFDDQSPRRFEDVIPVLRVTEDLEPGTSVYVRSGTRWVFTFTSSRPEGYQVRLKHTDAGFQDAFFDTSATLDDIRVDARPPELGGRRMKRSALARLRNSAGSPFDLGVKLFIAVIFVIVGYNVLRTFLFRW